MLPATSRSRSAAPSLTSMIFVFHVPSVDGPCSDPTCVVAVRFVPM
ncbi:MAG: hypothetical protein BWX70_03042 [Verrucomicrobia bacterium ADurb.Bin070]|nr:MAG: hypothetical protein BWX70_03042 [Verrucomicrobia bacterium ADurb.Bin070]